MRRVAEFKRENASLLDGLLPEHVKEAFLEHQVVNVMKGRDDKGRRVLIVNVGGKKVDLFHIFKLTKITSIERSRRTLLFIKLNKKNLI